MAATPQATVKLADLDEERGGLVKQLLSALLESGAVRKVFAQVIDGLPVGKTYDVKTTGRFELISRIKPSVESIALANEFCDPDDNLDTVKLNAKVVDLLSLDPPHSPSFNMHLLELVAIAIHDMAGSLFASNHPKGEPNKEKLDKTTYPGDVSLSVKPYSLSGQYPGGVSDVVGYWAETYIFGGVVLFDRGPDEEAKKSNGAYIHPPYSKEIFKLSERQLKDFVSQDNHEMLEIPFDSESRARKVNPTKAFLELNIYRDRYERYVPDPKATDTEEKAGT